MFTARAAPLRPADVRGALDAIAQQPHVVGVEPLRVAGDERTGYATVSYDAPADDLDGDVRERLESATGGLSGVDAAFAGEVLDGSNTGGFPIGEVAGLLIAIVLLVVVLRSLRAAGNALLAAFAGVGLGFAVLLWASTLTEVPRPRPDARRHARPRRRDRLCAPARRPPAGGAAGRPRATGGPRGAPARPPAAPRSPRPESCSSRSRV